MPHYFYTAFDEKGVEQSGSLDAVDVRQVSLLLRQRGIFATDVTDSAGSEKHPVSPNKRAIKLPATIPRGALGRGPDRRLRIPWGGSVGGKELAGFTRQLSTLLRAGMPLVRGLEVLAKSERKPGVARVVLNLAEVIKSGGTLSDAMAQHPRVFDRLYLNMIRAGEAGGVLDVVLERLAGFQEKSQRLKGKIKSAMAYPVIVLGVAMAILVGLLVFVVPKFQQIFADLLKGAPLPALTQAVLTTSEVVKSHYGVVAIGLGLAWVAGKLFGRTARGARLVASCVIRAPFFGQLILKGIVARMGRTLGTLLSSGVPILPALLITRDTCGNVRVADAIAGVHDRVKEGASIARPLEAARIFPPMVTSMIDVGEHTGQLPEMLGKVADIYEDEVDTAVAGLSSLIEPILILFLAIMVGTIVIALFLPIIRIVQLLT